MDNEHTWALRHGFDGLFKHTRFCGSCLWCCIFKRGRVAMGAHLPLIYLFFEVQPQHSRDYFCRSHFLASILTNTCDATFSATSSSFIIIMVRVRSCRILCKLTFSKPFFWIFFWTKFLFGMVIPCEFSIRALRDSTLLVKKFL